VARQIEFPNKKKLRLGLKENASMEQRYELMDAGNNLKGRRGTFGQNSCEFKVARPGGGDADKGAHQKGSPPKWFKRAWRKHRGGTTEV